MVTTIQITKNLQEQLAKKKLFERETYEEIIWDLIEDTKELSEEVKRELTCARNELYKRKSQNLSQLKKEIGIIDV